MALIVLVAARKDVLNVYTLITTLTLVYNAKFAAMGVPSAQKKNAPNVLFKIIPFILFLVRINALVVLSLVKHVKTLHFV